MRLSKRLPSTARGCWLFLFATVLFAPPAFAAPDGKESFQRSVEADIAIAEAEASADPNQARGLFKYARDLMPDDADVWFQSARFELTQKNDALALKFFDKAVALNPQHPLAPFDRAVLLYSMKRPLDAKAAFESYQTQNPLDVRAAYYLGLLALEGDDAQTAQQQFAMAKTGDDRTAAFAASYHAIVSAQLGDPKAGVFAREALAVAPTPELKAKLEPLATTAVADSSSGGERYLPWFNLRLDATIEYDSNAALAQANAAQLNSQILANTPSSDTDPAPTIAEPINAARLSESFSFTFRPVASEPVTLELEAAFVNANHLNSRSRDFSSDTNLARFDYFGPTGVFRLYSRFGDKTKIDFGFDGTYRGMWIGGSPGPRHLLNAGSLAPFIGVVFWPRHMLYLTGNFEFRDFVAEGISPSALGNPNNRDGFVYSGGLLYQVPASYFDFILAGAYDHEATFGVNFRLNGVRASAAVRFTWKNLTAQAYASLNARFYARALPARNEFRYETGLSVRYNIVQYFGLQASYSYTQNDAFNTDRTRYQELTYRRHTVGLTLIAQY